MATDSYALVVFGQVYRDEFKVWRGQGDGAVAVRGNKRQMMARMRAAGGNRAGYFVYQTDKPVGATMKGI